MKKSMFSEEQIAFALRMSETGTRVADVCRKMGIAEQTFYRWKKKYGGLGVPELRRLKQLEEENRRLKRMVADLSLDKQMLQDVWLVDSYRVSERRACEVIEISCSSQRYVSQWKDDRALRMRIREIAATRVRYGYLRIHVLLRRDGWRVNHKRVYRIYREEGLNLRRKRPRRHVSGSRRMDRPHVDCPNSCWSMDFVCDSLFNGRRFRALTIVDNYSRECPAIEVGKSITGSDVVTVMDRVVQERGVPKRIQCDNGSEFILRVLDKGAYENGVTMDFSRPGKPMDNAMIESFNGSFRDECLNVNGFLSLEDAKEKIELWRVDYNDFQPHSSLGDLTPHQFAEQFESRKTTFLAGTVFGFGSPSTCDSREAFALFKCNPEQFDLVITDVNMPYKDGLELTKILLSIRPDIPIVMSTDLTQFNLVKQQESFKAIDIKAFLIKPYEEGKLSSVISEMLSGSSSEKYNRGPAPNFRESEKKE